MLPAPALQAVNPAPVLGTSGAKIRSRPNLAEDGSAQAPEKSAAEYMAVTEAADLFPVDAPILSSSRIAHPSANPGPAPDTSLSTVSTPAVANDQAKAAVASFLPQRETSQPSTPAATARARTALAHFRPQQRETGQPPAAVASDSPPTSIETTSVVSESYGFAARANATSSTVTNGHICLCGVHVWKQGLCPWSYC
jgi:hypothetical protein